MRPLPFAVAGCVVLAACGPQPLGPQAAAAQADRAASGPTPRALVPPPTPRKSAQDFVARAAGADAFELQAAQQAMQRASNGDVKTFAAMVLRDHRKSAADLQKAVADSGQALSVPDGVPADLQSALSELAHVDAGGFDRTYVAGQLRAHSAALALLQDYAQNGDVTSLTAFAAETLPVIQSHYQAAESLREAMK
jgi:putative membrane protein